MLLESFGGGNVVIAGDFNTLMFTLEVTKKTIRTSMEVVIMELGSRKREGFLSFVQLKT